MPIGSVEELIFALEPIEQSEISSDIQANVRAELKRMKRNVSLILRFIPSFRSSESPASSELQKAIADLRRECLSINSTVSRILILQTLRADRWIDYSARISDHYAAMAEAARRMCVITAPLQVQELAKAL